jgi:hypothetical protein
MNTVFSWFFFLDCNLVVPQVVVEEAEQVAAHRGVGHLINPRQPEGVLVTEPAQNNSILSTKPVHVAIKQ